MEYSPGLKKSAGRRCHRNGNTTATPATVKKRKLPMLPIKYPNCNGYGNG